MPNWNNYLYPICSFFFFAFLICAFLYPCLSAGDPLEHFASATQPFGNGGWGLICVERTRVFSGAPPTVESSVLGTVDPRANFARGKTALPRVGARNHARVDQVSFRMTASTVRSSGQSSFPFLERTSTGSPSECERFPPTGETHGALAGQDSIPLGGSQGRA